MDKVMSTVVIMDDLVAMIKYRLYTEAIGYMILCDTVTNALA